MNLIPKSVSHSSSHSLVISFSLVIVILMVGCGDCGIVAGIHQTSEDLEGVSQESEEDHFQKGQDVTFDMSEDDASNFFVRREDTDEEKGASQPRSTEVELCPPLPSEAVPQTSRLCHAPRCRGDDECSSRNNANDNSFVCCFNGCVHSCMLRVEPPLAFDWLEETDMRFLRNETEQQESSEEGHGTGVRTKVMLHALAESEIVALPGGCQINLQQYEDLVQFRKNQHVNSCSCASGDIVCEVNQVSI